MLLSASSDADDQTAVPSLRDLVGFTVPLLGIGLASPVLGLIDSAVVGRFAGALQLAALTPAVALTDIVAYLFRGLASATTYFVASALADGDGERERRAVRNAVTFAAACGVVAGALQYFGCVPLLQLLSGGAHHTYPLGDAAAYARVRACGLPAALILMVMQAAFLGRREWRAPTLAVAVACVLNLLTDLLLVACLHLGVLGAAVATVLAQAGDLRLHVGAADHQREAERAGARARRDEAARDGVHLHGELARRLDDERADLVRAQRVLAPPQQLEERDEEGERLPRPRARLHRHVLVAQQPRDRRLLHRRRRPEVVRVERCQGCGVERRRERGEGDGGGELWWCWSR